MVNRFGKYMSHHLCNYFEPPGEESQHSPWRAGRRVTSFHASVPLSILIRYVNLSTGLLASDRSLHGRISEAACTCPKSTAPALVLTRCAIRGSVIVPDWRYFTGRRIVARPSVRIASV